MIIMKLSTLLLSSAAVLVAGAAVAADLPAKKAAKAAATGCTEFGPGFIQLPGEDVCLKIGGLVRMDSAVTSDSVDNTTAKYSFTPDWQVNFDARSKTEIGDLRGFINIENGALEQGYVQFAGITAGQKLSNFVGYNGAWFMNTTDAGHKPLQLSYTMGGLTLALENALNHNVPTTTNYSYTYGYASPIYNIAGKTGYGVAQLPDFVAAYTTTSGPVTLKVAGALHEVVGMSSLTLSDSIGDTPFTYNTVSGTGTGYAAMGEVKFALAPTTDLYGEVAYANGAIGYLGNVGSTYGPAGITHAWASISDSNDDVSSMAHGYNGLLSIHQGVGKGTIIVDGSYGQVTSAAVAGVNTIVKTLEVSYDYKPVKNLTVAPVFSYNEVTAASSTTSNIAWLRIERDF